MPILIGYYIMRFAIVAFKIWQLQILGAHDEHDQQRSHDGGAEAVANGGRS
jgi:hypothetical protein